MYLIVVGIVVLFNKDLVTLVNDGSVDSSNMLFGNDRLVILVNHLLLVVVNLLDHVLDFFVLMDHVNLILINLLHNWLQNMHIVNIRVGMVLDCEGSSWKDFCLEGFLSFFHKDGVSIVLSYFEVSIVLFGSLVWSINVLIFLSLVDFGGLLDLVRGLSSFIRCGRVHCAQTTGSCTSNWCAVRR